MLRFVARERGVYRVNVDPDGNRTTLLVREGDADVYATDQAYRLEKGRGATFEGTGNRAHFVAYADSDQDDWDRWEGSRAARVEHSSGYRHVSDDVYGVEDLDEYGTWNEDPRYGAVWRPTHVEAGWSPFTSGRWVWLDPWGWNWVDYEPWGWAPCHYGRWVYADDYWAWAPGPIVRRPVYAPAVVGFLGFGGGGVSVGVSVGAGSGPVGWVPVGYGEPIVPWWGASRA
jgi:hypothetical protein